MTEPIATLHDDGYYTWNGDKPHGFNYAGWRLKVYGEPKRTPSEAEAAKAVDALRRIAELEITLHEMCEDQTINPSHLAGAGLRDAIRIAKLALYPASDTSTVAREVIEPLTEPVSISKALLGGKEAHVVQAVGKEVAVFLVNIQLTRWRTSPMAQAWVEGYVEGFNIAAKFMQGALVERYRVNATRYEDCRKRAIERGMCKTPEEYDEMIDKPLSNNR